MIHINYNAPASKLTYFPLIFLKCRNTMHYAYQHFLFYSPSISFISLHIKRFSMETSRIIYTGDLRTEATHVKSGQTFITDAPLDNQGKGEAFSPTDLLATSLGACAITVVGIAARAHGFNVDGTEVKITKIMAAEPRRVGEVIVEFNFPDVKYSKKEKTIIRHTIKTCPVSQSLRPELIQNFIINFSD
jgi:uncharacterized OsmC-like protein